MSTFTSQPTTWINSRTCGMRQQIYSSPALVVQEPIVQGNMHTEGELASHVRRYRFRNMGEDERSHVQPERDSAEVVNFHA